MKKGGFVMEKIFYGRWKGVLLKRSILMAVLFFCAMPVICGASDIYLKNGGVVQATITGADSHVVKIMKEIRPFIIFGDSFYVPDSIPRDTIEAVAGKDPNFARGLAIFPGLLVHCAGHFYTEDTPMGILLAGTEILSLGCAIAGTAQNNLGLIITGWTAFAGSWVCGMVHAPISARQYNERISKVYNLPLRVQWSLGKESSIGLAYEIEF